MCNLPMRLLIVVACCALLWFGYSGLKEGKVRVKGGGLVDRYDSPAEYWLSVWIYLGVGAAGIGFAIFF